MRSLFLIKCPVFRPASLFTALFFIILGGIAEPVFAHKVTVFAWVEGDQVFTQSKFSGGKKVKNGKIVVTDGKGKEYLTGQTDDQGEFAFRIPGKTDLDIEVIAGMGHRNHWLIPEEEISSAGSKTESSATPAVSQALPLSPVSKKQSAEEKSGTYIQITPQELEAMIDKALDKKMKPLFKIMMDQQEKGPGMNEIIGGIGYIFGLMGVALYFQARKRKDE